MKLRRLAISEEGFIFDPETGSVFSANETGVFILKQLISGATAEEVIQRMVETFNAELERARVDFIEFVEQLRLYGLWENEG